MLAITDSTISENTVSSSYTSFGGGIYNDSGELTVTNSTISGNGASCLPSSSSSNSHCWGGGILNEDGELTVTSSIISENTADYGGGIYNRVRNQHNYAIATIEDSEFFKNNVNGSGGAIYNDSSATTEIIHSTFSENRATYGGGIHNSGEVNISDSIIENNTAELGGGINFNSGTMLIADSTISQNTATYDGAGIRCSSNDDPTITVTNSIITQNTTSRNGGGIFNIGVIMTISGCTVSNNIATKSGGGIYFETESATIKNSKILMNTAKLGGGIYSDDWNGSSIDITNSSIAQNTVTEHGGGIYNTANIMNVTNSVISDNTANYGGGVYNYSGQLTVTNDTISANMASLGGGIYNYSDLGVYNCIIGLNGNENTNGQDIWTYNREYAQTRVASSLISVANAKTGKTFYSYGNLMGTSENPLSPGFIDRENGDYSLLSTSVAIDAGHNFILPQGTEMDVAGNMRIQGKQIDMGAYEFASERPEGTLETASTIVTTGIDVVDAYDGLISLREAIAYAEVGETVTFDETVFANDCVVELCGKELVIDKSIYIDASNLANKVTIDANKVSRVVSILGGDKVEVQLKNLLLTGGNAGGVKVGGGIYADGILTMTECTISGNTSAYGGGICLSSSRAYITDCIISENTILSTKSGGGITCQDGTFTITDCTISGNTSGYGGGIYQSSGKLNIINCIISENEATYGGGLDVRGDTVITNSLISNNEAESDGGGIHCYQGFITLTNCTIAGNRTMPYYYNEGCGIYSYSGKITAYNTIIAENSGSTEIVGRITAYNCLTASKMTNNNNFVYNSDLPLFVAGSGYQLLPFSQAWNAGSNQYAYNAGLNKNSYCVNGATRLSGVSIDIGAYESVAVDFSQYTVYNKSVNISWEQYSQNLRLSWISGVSKTVLGTFAAEGEFDWDTTQYANGYGRLLFEYLDESGSVVLQLDFNSVIINDENVVIHRDVISTSETWSKDKTHVVAGRVEVASGAEVTVENGAIVKFCEGAYLYAKASSNLTLGENVILTRLEDDTVGGDTNADGNLSVPQVGNSYLRGSGNFTIPASVQMKYVLQTTSGTISSDQTWLPGQVYHVTGNLTVASGATLTILPGAIVKFDPGTSLIVQGTLNAEGNAAQPIIFTSIKDDSYGGDTNEDDGELTPQAGDWNQIRIAGGNATLNHTKVLYGGSDANNSDDGAIYVASGSMTLSNSVVAHSKLVGTHSGSNAKLDVYNSVIEDCMYGTHNGNYYNCTFNGLTYLMNTNYYYYGGSYTNCIIANVTNKFYSSNTPSNYTYTNCVFYNPKGTGQQSFSAVGSNGNIWANPLFRDAANGDYRLQVGSPCIDAADGIYAPETDITGAPRYDDPYTNDVDDKFADIGAYEFNDFAASNIDLEVIDVKAPASISHGEEITVQWTLRNNGSDAAVGTWTDEIYLVSEYGAKILVAPVTHAGNITGNNTQTFSAQVAVPPTVNEGKWYFAVQANPNREIFEGATTGNNFLRAITVTEVKLPSLTLSDNFTIGENEQLYRLDLAAGQEYTLKYTYQDTNAMNRVSIVARDGLMPTDNRYDWSSVTASTSVFAKADITHYDRVSYLYIPAAEEARTIYLRLYTTNSSVTGKMENVANYFSITGFTGGITDDEITKYQYAYESVIWGERSTVTIIGTGFEEGMTARIIPKQGAFGFLSTTTLEAQVKVLTPNMATLTFNMADETIDQKNIPHTYDLVVNETTMPNAIKTLAPTAASYGKLTATLDIPDSVRSGRTYIGYVNYTNNTTQILEVPVFTIYSESNTSIGYLNETPTAGNSIQLLGIGTQQPGYLAPGESGRVAFQFIAGNGTKINLGSWVNNQTTTPMFESEYWSTWAEFHADLCEAVNQLATRGERNIRYDDACDLLDAQKSGSAATGLSGFLTYPGTTEGLANCELVASWTVGEETFYDYATSDSEGFYLFNFLPQDTEITLELQSGAYNLSQTTVTLTGNKDVTNFNLTALPFSTISGRVTDVSGRSVGNITLTAETATGERIYATTDRYGAFTFENAQQTTYTVNIDTYGKYLSVTPQTVAVLGSNPTSGVNFTLDPGITISGTITDENGVGVEGVDIYIQDVNENIFNVTTNADGQYSISGFIAGELQLKTMVSGYISTIQKLVLTDSEDTVCDMTLMESYSLSGTVRNADGTVISGATIVLTNSEEELFHTTTLEDGTYTLEELKPGAYQIEIYSADNALNQRSEITLASKETSGIDFTWTVLASVTGTVTNGSSETISGLSIILSDGEQSWLTETNAQGQYTFANLMAGTYSVQVSGTTYAQTVTCEESASVTQNIELPYVGVISGMLKTAEGTSAEFAQIWVYQEGKQIVKLFTDENGQFSIYFNEAGSYDVYASGSDGIYSAQTGVSVESGSEITLQMELGTKSVSVACENLLNETEAITWVIAHLDKDGYAIERIQGESTTASFNIQGLVVGDYKLLAYQGNYYAESTFTISDSEETVNTTLSFEEKSTLSVTVQLPNDAEVALENTVAFLYDLEYNLVAQMYADEEGNLKFELLDAGNYTLVLFNGKYAQSVAVTVDEVTETQTVTLAETSVQFTGTVTLDGVKVEDACILLTDANGMVVGIAYSDAEGNFTVYALASEVCNLQAWSGNSETCTLENIQKGQSIAISLTSSNVPAYSLQITPAAQPELLPTESVVLLPTSDLILQPVGAEIPWYQNNWLGKYWRQEGFLKEANENFSGHSIQSTDCCNSCGYMYPVYNRTYRKATDYKMEAESALADLKKARDDISSKALDTALSTGSLIVNIISFFVPGGKIPQAIKLFGTVIDCVQIIKIGIETIPAVFNKETSEAVAGLCELLKSDLRGIVADFCEKARKELGTIKSDLQTCSQNGTFLDKDLIEAKIKSLQVETKAITDKFADIGQKLEKVSQGVTNVFNTSKQDRLLENAIDLENLKKVENLKKAAQNATAVVKGIAGCFGILDLMDIVAGVKKLNQLGENYNNAYDYCNDRVFDFKYEVEKLDREYPHCTNSSCSCHDDDDDDDPPKDDPKDDDDSDEPKSEDPNEVTGPVGVDFEGYNAGTEDEPFLVITSDNWISGEETYDYYVYFENKASASAAAQEVFVDMVMPEGWDWETFELTEVCVGNQIFDEMNGYADGIWTVSQTSTGDKIQISSTIDEETGEVKWYLRSWVESTSDHFPTDAYTGFLPPNDENHSGEAYVKFRVKFRDDLVTGDKVEASASIVFDTNEAIVTNTWHNTLDREIPTATLTSVTFVDNAINLAWEGGDGDGSGIHNWNVYVSVNGADATLWQSFDASVTTATYTEIDAESVYEFYLVAADKAGRLSDSAEEKWAVSAKNLISNLKLSNNMAFLNAPLTATVKEDAATVNYQWYLVTQEGYEYKIEGATSVTYTPRAEELGYYLKVVVTGIGDYVGELSSMTIAPVLKNFATPILQAIDGRPNLGTTESFNRLVNLVTEWDTLNVEMRLANLEVPAGAVVSRTVTFDTGIYRVDADALQVADGWSASVSSETDAEGMCTMNLIFVAETEMLLDKHVVASLSLTPTGTGMEENTMEMLGVTIEKMKYDMTGDGAVTILDLVEFARLFDPEGKKGELNAPADFNGDGKVDIHDLVKFARQFNKKCPVLVENVGNREENEVELVPEPVSENVPVEVFKTVAETVSETVVEPVSAVVPESCSEAGPAVVPVAVSAAISEVISGKPAVVTVATEAEMQKMPTAP
ncbi:MAG: carboxypeptidase regulatory-like domain-containing protein, partial [Planctomycetia bacterium]|nr:carboxypeptidase regulatory-like domain-containing protein [Planctomycetia bacterium]